VTADLLSLVDDADADPTNECIVSTNGLELDGTTLRVTDGCGPKSIDLDALVDDADADPLNECNTALTLDGTALTVSDACGGQTIDLSSLICNDKWKPCPSACGEIYPFCDPCPAVKYIGESCECDGQCPYSCSSDTCCLQSPGIVSLWKGENDPNDSIGTNDASLEGNMTYGSGKFASSRAFQFNGNNSFLSVDSWVGLNMTAAYAFQAWIFLNGASFTDANYDVFAVRGTDIPLSHNIEIYRQTPDKKLVVFHNRNGPGTSAYIRFNDPDDIGRWYHLAVTYDGNSAPKAYKDGIPLSTHEVVGSFPQAADASSSPWEFGRGQFQSSPGTYAYLNGKMDEIAIYNRALTPAEVQCQALNSCSECSSPPGNSTTTTTTTTTPIASTSTTTTTTTTTPIASTSTTTTTTATTTATTNSHRRRILRVDEKEPVNEDLPMDVVHGIINRMRENGASPDATVRHVFCSFYPC